VTAADLRSKKDITPLVADSASFPVPARKPRKLP
jgi:hypothetical protein